MGRGLKAWLYTVCRNRALDILRKEKRLVLVKDEELLSEKENSTSPDYTADWDERVSLVMNTLEQLPGNQREVIRLKFQQELSYKEISEATGLAVGNVGFLLHTGLKRLRSLLPEDLLENHLSK